MKFSEQLIGGGFMIKSFNDVGLDVKRNSLTTVNQPQTCLRHSETNNGQIIILMIITK